MSQQTGRLLPEEEQTLAAYNQVGAQWAADHDKPGYWDREMNHFQLLLPSGRVIEIGAGGGRDAKELISRGYMYTGTDISTGLLEVARQALPNQTFIEQSVYELSFDEAFDGFWASAVLLHIPRNRILEALLKIRQTQREGGIGFISLKDGIGEQEETEVIDGQEIRRHFIYWTREEFELVLAQANFELAGYNFNPVSARTKWHCFFVRAI